MKILTLSFLTESKASHACLSSIRRVAITLLVMLLATTGAWAQFFPQTNYQLSLSANYQGGAIGMVDVPVSDPTYTLASYDEPTREGYAFCGWSTSSTGDVVEYKTGDQVKLTGNQTLYAIWDDNPYIITLNSSYDGGAVKSILVPSIDPTYTLTSNDEPAREGYMFFGWSTSSTGGIEYKTGDQVKLTGNQTLYAVWEETTNVSGLKYSITDEDKRQVMVTGYEKFPTGTLNIPATVTINGTKYSVTSIGDDAFFYCTDLQSVTIPNSVTTIGDDAFAGCYSLQSVTINGNPKIGDDAFGGTLATVTMNLTASEIDGDYWTTFYNDGYNFQADEYTKVYKGMVNESSLMLTEVEDKIVNSGTAVILKSSGNPVMTLTESGSNDTNGSDLRGISDRTKRTSVISNFSANEIYTMGYTSAGFGFHRYTGEYVPAGKAFLPLYIENEAGAKALSLTIVFANETTGINSVSSDSNVQNDWFTLDGTRLSGMPTQPGIYINGKKKIAIK